MKKRCAYCGAENAKTRDHVISDLLYPASKQNSKVQRLTVPACKACNVGWSDDEPHFRTVLTIAGEPNSIVRELWDGKVNRAFRELDGRRRFSEIWERLRNVKTSDGERHQIFPANDPRVLRILRKIIRGLHYHHDLWNPVPDDMVFVDSLRVKIPEEFTAAMSIHHREPDIFQYQYEVFDEFEDIPMSSAWLLRFFETRRFVGLVWKPGRAPQAAS